MYSDTDKKDNTAFKAEDSVAKIEDPKKMPYSPNTKIEKSTDHNNSLKGNL